MNDSGRYRHLVVVGAVVALALLAIAALLVHLGNPPSADEPPARATSGGPGSDHAVVDAPGGPTSEHAGVPTGFSRDEAGAVAAAVSYAGAAQRWLYWTDAEITAAVAQMATPESADRLTSESLATVRAARDELGTSPGRVWWLVHPLAWRVEQFSPDQATVAVWTMRLLSASEVAAPQTEWLTFTLDLDWVQGDWRLATVRDTPGPTPMTGPRDDPWQAEPFDDALTGFTRLDGEAVRRPEEP
ncbi:MAG: hypothetical protein ACRDUY_09720 [Nitriliruptorales bacterium]